ncbi:MAG TPA: DinB family protein [Actinomycetota bacterium]|nr:DinB family protein [Actinomycetota bacterium]
MSTRLAPPYAADERTMLIAFLDYYRETMLATCEGLSDEQLRWKPAATANSLLALTLHLAYVEKWWFAEGFLGEPPEPLPAWADPEDRDWEMKPPADFPFADAVRMYRENAARSNEIVRAAASLDDVGMHPDHIARGITLRWILVHMVEETARHAGHADITRELIDGTVGL